MSLWQTLRTQLKYKSNNGINLSQKDRALLKFFGKKNILEITNNAAETIIKQTSIVFFFNEKETADAHSLSSVGARSIIQEYKSIKCTIIGLISNEQSELSFNPDNNFPYSALKAYEKKEFEFESKKGPDLTPDEKKEKSKAYKNFKKQIMNSTDVCSANEGNGTAPNVLAYFQKT